MSGRIRYLPALALLALACGGRSLEPGDAGRSLEPGEAGGSPEAGEAGGPLEPVDASYAGDAPDCGGGTGAIAVTVSTLVEGCSWQIMPSTSSTTELATGATEDCLGSSCPPVTFSVTCLPAGSNYWILCYCDPLPAFSTPYGQCSGGQIFSVVPGTTSQVLVDVGCPA